MNNNLNIIFAGSSAFSYIILSSIYMAGFSVQLILTKKENNPIYKAKNKINPVRYFAETVGIKLINPYSLNIELKETKDILSSLKIIDNSIIIVASYGLILPKEIINASFYNCINIHASLLPRWRGAAPIQRAIEAGDKITGITLIKMDDGIDTGNIIQQESIIIRETDNALNLSENLAKLGAKLIINELNFIKNHSRINKSLPQSSNGITYAKKINKIESYINWNESANKISRKINAFYPLPGAITRFNGSILKILIAEPIDQSYCKSFSAGQIISIRKDSIFIACGKNILKLVKLQKQGRKALYAKEFISGASLYVGQTFY